MKRIICFALLGVFLLVVGCSRQTIEKTYYSEILLDNLDVPWSIDFLPNNDVIFTERNGEINLYNFDTNKLTKIGRIEVNQESEAGLLGIAVDPEFNKNNFIYIYYTHKNGNRVSRFVLKEQIQDEKILLDNIPNARFHDGGRIKFGPDNKLYITTGDATTSPSAQDTGSLAGKILRMNKDGSIPNDNPFNNYVYSYGHRNPQGIAWHPLTNKLYSSEHGQSRNDEINLILKGANYGWPLVECTETTETFKNPIRCYSEFTLAPSGIAFNNNELYVAGLRGTQLRKLIIDADKVLSEEILISNLGRIRDVVVHKGYLYIATNNRDGRGSPSPNDDKIVRIKL
ncbi:PQQ-dependent sugar dehydrogenase [Candidatus Woesearchaeota archaeon]|nr:PQQ-dependent sugar dehydrogenase [Candidatus Woesearchaeota archaeon]